MKLTVTKVFGTSLKTWQKKVYVSNAYSVGRGLTDRRVPSNQLNSVQKSMLLSKLQRVGGSKRVFWFSLYASQLLSFGHQTVFLKKILPCGFSDGHGVAFSVLVVSAFCPRVHKLPYNRYVGPAVFCVCTFSFSCLLFSPPRPSHHRFCL